ncbi:MAG TPA: RAMP superfamily CRISPR-associated protein [Thermoanaerobaculia bacterium]|nr:RAMP superfamily CRISPR-associated protein [Thermoanaerobaculia bacterium]
MDWLKGTIEEYKGGRPEHQEMRKIRTHPDQAWEELHFFRLSWARRAGYPDTELEAGRTIEFEPDLHASRPQVLRFRPYRAGAHSDPPRREPTRTFLNPYHFVPLAPPPSLTDAETVVQGTLHDRFDGHGESGPRRYSGRVVCRLETEGPVVLGAEQPHVDHDADRERVIQPFGMPDPEAPDDPYRRTPMIPGSTLRGMISAIFEAASCSTLRVLADGAFQCRDATRKKVLIPGSIHTAVATVSPDLIPLHAGRTRLTLAEQVFGFVEQGGDQRALAGRLRFAHALVESQAPDGGWYDEPVLLKILDAPKPPSPALYFGNQGYLSKEKLDLTRHSPQGRKLYLHHRKGEIEACRYESQRQDRMKQKAIVRPLRTRTSFLFHVDFGNLTSEELGYLLYALRPTPEFRHKLGMAKPLGLGRVRIDPLALGFIDRRHGYSSGSLFGPKYHGLESRLEAAAWRNLSPELASRYRYEAEAAAAPEPAQHFPTLAGLAEMVRQEIPQNVRFALELIGDPGKVDVEVSYPVLRGQDPETEHFKWFVANDKREKKPLPALKPGEGLPVLVRYDPRR